MRVDPKNAVLVGTYATQRLGEIVAMTLETEGIAAEVVLSGEAASFPPLDLVSGAVGVFVPRQRAEEAREIVQQIEAP